jgi:hypothetical protein
MPWNSVCMPSGESTGWLSIFDHRSRRIRFAAYKKLVHVDRKWGRSLKCGVRHIFWPGVCGFPNRNPKRLRHTVGRWLCKKRRYPPTDVLIVCGYGGVATSGR